MTRPLTAVIQHDTDNIQSVPTNAALVACFDDEQAQDFNILTYWHQPSDGRPGYVVVEIEDLASDRPDGGPLTPVRVRHNEAVVYDWLIS